MSTSGSPRSNSHPLRVALFGSGIFATNAHAPILRSNPDLFHCVCIWSRNKKNASILADTFPHDCIAYGGEEDLDKILSCSVLQIDAIIMALPIDIQPKYILRIFDSGMHILSEKPIAPTIEIGYRLLQEYKTKYQSKGILWSVAENFRCEKGLIQASEAVKNNIGKPLQLSMILHSPFTIDNKYLKTDWRSQPSWEGGLFIDAFIHGAAAIRMLTSAANYKPKAVSAIVSKHSNHIPDVDTLSANILFEKEGGGENATHTNSFQGVVTVSYAVSEPYVDIVVTGTKGRMHLTRNFGSGKKPGYQVKITNSSKDDTGNHAHYDFTGVENELKMFATLVNNNSKSNNCNKNPIDPEEALSDLAFVEACLKSGKNNGNLCSIETFPSL